MHPLKYYYIFPELNKGNPEDGGWKADRSKNDQH